MVRSVLAIAAVGLAAASVSGGARQSPEPIQTGIPERYDLPDAGPFSIQDLGDRARPLGSAAPRWASRLYYRSLRVLLALTDPDTGAMIAGERDGWDHVWPRDAAAGAIALQAAGLDHEARRVVAFLSDLDLNAARFHPDGAPVPGRPEPGDAEGWIAAAGRAAGVPVEPPGGDWRDRQDYGENVTGDLLGNAIAAGVPAAEITERFLTPRGLVREEGGEELDSAVAWAVVPFANRRLRGAARRTLLEIAGQSTPYGIPPIEGWTPDEVWTAPAAWSAWALTELGETRMADRLLRELHHAATPEGALPERVSVVDGHPTSTTPLAWSHAFAVLALRARYRTEIPRRPWLRATSPDRACLQSTRCASPSSARRRPPRALP